MGLHRDVTGDEGEEELVIGEEKNKGREKKLNQKKKLGDNKKTGGERGVLRSWYK